jgi:lysyl-tRNA synthetase class 2
MIEQTGANPAFLTADTITARLIKRAALLSKIRSYFSSQQVLEVETPILSPYAVTDPQLDNLRVENPFAISEDEPDNWLYLSTSPEYGMKQLLSLGSGSIYQISKAFRQDPPGRLHGSEFTLLEWYRLDYDMDALIDDVASLIHSVSAANKKPLAINKISYQQAFLDYVGIDPLSATAAELEAVAQHSLDVSFTSQDKDIWLDLLLTHCVEPKLGQGAMTFLYNYPESQAALAQLAKDDNGNTIAKRFELYIDGIELANGYFELTDADEQLQRFEKDNILRQQAGKEVRNIDPQFMRAMQRGLPECSGVALGVDRLLLVI